MRLKKGAMFGLDARIALAIFGALSVISGAALYSAIGAANTQKWNQYFVELTKATEAYHLDNGKPIDIAHTSNYTLYLEDTAANRENLSTWKGPYWPVDLKGGRAVKDNMTSLIHPDAYAVLYMRQASDWAAMDDISADEFCVRNSSDCSEWLAVYAGHTDGTSNVKNVFDMLDEYHDDSDGPLKGKIRYNTYGYDIVMYKSNARILR